MLNEANKRRQHMIVVRSQAMKTWGKGADLAEAVSNLCKASNIEVTEESQNHALNVRYYELEGVDMADSPIDATGLLSVPYKDMADIRVNLMGKKI
jgi:hypothetical protein